MNLQRLKILNFKKVDLNIKSILCINLLLKFLSYELSSVFSSIVLYITLIYILTLISISYTHKDRLVGNGMKFAGHSQSYI